MQEIKRRVFDPWVGKIPWRRKWPPTAGFLPGESHGQRSLEGYCPRGFKESDTTERLRTAERHSRLNGYTGEITMLLDTKAQNVKMSLLIE